MRGSARRRTAAVAVSILGALLLVAGCSSKSKADVPGAPTNAAAVPSNASAKVSFTPPTDDGGRPISDYAVSCTSGNSGPKGAIGPQSPIVVSGLANGHSYTCIVTARNATGSSAPSAKSNAFVPVGVPGAPTPASAVPFDSGVAKVAWNAPASTGGSPITSYVVTPFLGSVAQPPQTFKSPATTQNIGGLTNGRAYQFEITAHNAVGASAQSTKTGVMTAGAPGQPGDTKAAKVASGSLKVSFTAPANNGAEITSYTATCTSTNGDEKKAATGAGQVITLSNRALTVASLTVGQSYTCTVKAQNSRGVGPRSNPSPAATA